MDPRPFEAALAQAKGALARDKANQAKADADEKRASDLFTRKVISDQERDTAVAAAGSSRANVEADEAAVKQAELNLAYTRIISPIDGVAGIATAQVGDLVGPSSGALATVSQTDPIKAIVTAGEGPFSDLIKRHPDAEERQRYVNALEFELILGSGDVYPQKGKFYALDRNLDPKTGAIRYEVTFPNPGNNLRPGQFGKVRFVADLKKDAMVIPQPRGAVQFDHVGFRYKPDVPLIEDLSLEVEPGKMIAIVGATGAGKTTLVQLLARLYDPTLGSVLVDGTDVRDVDLRSLRRNIAVVNDDPFLFSATVAENIAYG
ncbi:MAG: efflux RND transporter periplasmic adaptor subunit, partial [Chthoniobacterales bacterium]